MAMTAPRHCFFALERALILEKRSANALAQLRKTKRSLRTNLQSHYPGLSQRFGASAAAARIFRTSVPIDLQNAMQRLFPVRQSR